MAATTPTPGGRALASALRSARNDAGLTLRDLAARVGLAHTTIAQWERSRSVPGSDDVARLLGAMGVTGDAYRRIMDFAKHASEPNRLTTGVPGVSEALSTVIECERSASRITEWAPLVVPGLLQTSEYARALLDDADGNTRETDWRVTLRVGRRETLTRKGAPEVTVLLGESALRTLVGGAPVMVEQWRHVVTMSRRDNVSVLVVPWSAGNHPGLAGPFGLFEFDSVAPTVYIESFRSQVFLSDTPDVPAYVDAVKKIRSLALSEDDSRDVVNGLISEHNTQHTHYGE